MHKLGGPKPPYTVPHVPFRGWCPGQAAWLRRELHTVHNAVGTDGTPMQLFKDYAGTRVASDTRYLDTLVTYVCANKQFKLNILNT